MIAADTQTTANETVARKGFFGEPVSVAGLARVRKDSRRNDGSLATPATSAIPMHTISLCPRDGVFWRIVLAGGGFKTV